jgi:hypothetical protein
MVWLDLMHSTNRTLQRTNMYVQHTERREVCGYTLTAREIPKLPLFTMATSEIFRRFLHGIRAWGRVGCRQVCQRCWVVRRQHCERRGSIRSESYIGYCILNDAKQMVMQVIASFSKTKRHIYKRCCLVHQCFLFPLVSTTTTGYK